MVVKYMFRVTRSVPVAQELTQDLFMRVWQHRSGLTDIRQFDAYLFIISRNLAFNKLKQLARERTKLMSLEDPSCQEAETGGEELNHYRELSALMEKAIASLPPQQREVYLLSREEGLTHQLISKRLNISPETSKKHMVLALKAIRGFLQQYDKLLLGFLYFFMV